MSWQAQEPIVVCALPVKCLRTHGPGAGLGPGPGLVSGKILQLIKTAGLVNGVRGWVMCAGATIYWDSYCQIIRRRGGGGRGG